MKAFLKTSIILTACLLCASYFAAAKKTLLLENLVCNGFSFTPPTIWHTDSIQGLYPDDVILVRLHLDKDSFYDTWVNDMIDSLGTPYLSFFHQIIRGDRTYSYIAYLNRKMYENSTGQMEYPIPRDLYPYVKEGLEEKEKLSVSVDWSFDRDSRKLFAKVHAIMLETIERPIRFNLYVVEDSVMGHGVGWDQYNGISGKTAWLPCPYVHEPDTIPDFLHRHVLRKALGGTFGVQGSFEIPANIGKYYTHDFQCNIDPEWNIDRLSVVGFVQVYDKDNDDFEVLNAARGVFNDLSFTVNSSSGEFLVLDKNDSFEKVFTLQNISNEAKEYEYSISKSERTPSGWSLSNEGTETVLLQPDESKDIIVDLSRDGASGIGDAILSIREAQDPSCLVWKEKMTVYSKEITHFHVTDEYGFMEYSLQPMLDELGRNDIFEVTPSFLMNNSDEFPYLKTIIWNTGYYLEAMDSVRIAHLVKWNNEGKNVFLGGNAGAIDHIHYYYPDFFGIGLLAYTYNLSFTGFSNDPISGFLADTNSFVNTFGVTSLLDIKNSDLASKVLKINEDGIVDYLKEDWSTYDSTISSEDAVFAAKIEKENSRAFIMIESFYLIANRDTAKILLNNMINWLDGISDIEEYEIGDGRFYLDVFPNPAYSHIKVRFAYDDILTEYIEIGLFDISGRKVKPIYNGMMNPGEKQIDLDVSDMSAGIYYVKLMNSAEILAFPIIVFR